MERKKSVLDRVTGLSQEGRSGQLALGGWRLEPKELRRGGEKGAHAELDAAEAETGVPVRSGVYMDPARRCWS
jgi:hypothetical protein